MGIEEFQLTYTDEPQPQLVDGETPEQVAARRAFIDSFDVPGTFDIDPVTTELPLPPVRAWAPRAVLTWREIWMLAVGAYRMWQLERATERLWARLLRAEEDERRERIEAHFTRLLERDAAERRARIKSWFKVIA